MYLKAEDGDTGSPLSSARHCEDCVEKTGLTNVTELFVVQKAFTHH